MLAEPQRCIGGSLAVTGFLGLAPAPSPYPSMGFPLSSRPPWAFSNSLAAGAQFSIPAAGGYDPPATGGSHLFPPRGCLFLHRFGACSLLLDHSSLMSLKTKSRVRSESGSFPVQGCAASSQVERQYNCKCRASVLYPLQLVVAGSRLSESPGCLERDQGSQASSSAGAHWVGSPGGGLDSSPNSPSDLGQLPDYPQPHFPLC